MYLFVFGKTLNEYGDYESCLQTALGQYVLVTVQGKVSNKFVKVFGGEGKFFSFGSVIGICVPTKCDEAYTEQILEPIFHHMALTGGYSTADVKFTFVSNMHAEMTASTNLNYMMAIPIFFLLISIFFGFLGLVIEFTQIGNRKDIAIIQTIKIIDYKSWNMKILLHKETWALFFLAFSPSRNTFYLLGRRRKEREYKKASKKAHKSISNLKIVDGIRGLCLIMICYAQAFELAQYSLVNNLEELPDQNKSFWFNILIANSYAFAEIFLFLSGITQAISFLQSSKDGRPRFLDIFTCIFFRLLKIVPMYYIILLFQVYIYRLLGYGPLWNYFDKIFEPCEKFLWPNLLFINNLYPNFGNKDSICLPWTWYIAVYVQLSVLTPIVVYFLYRLPRVFLPIHLVTLGGGSVVAQAFQIGFEETGISPAFDDKYWSNVYTKPWHHYNIQIGLGVIFGILFNQYIEKRQKIDEGDKHKNNLGYTCLKFIKKKIMVRFIIDMVGVFLFFLSGLIGWLYIRDDKQWSQASQILFGVFRSLITIFGVILILLPLMLSKSRILRFFFKMRGFLILSQLSFGVYLWFPIACLGYYYHQHQMTFVNYLNMIYYSVGSFLFALLISYGGYILIQAPLQAILSIYGEAEQIRHGQGDLKFKFKFIKIEKNLF